MSEKQVRALVVYPDKRLREPCLEVTEFNEEAKEFAEELKAALAHYRGAGLAAPQIGVPIQMFALEATVCSPVNSGPKIFINPQIVYPGVTLLEIPTVVGKEGCLSFPGVYLNVARHTTCLVKAYDENGTPFEVEAEGFYARAIQHENDHLNGKLFVDFVSYMQKERIIKKMKKLKRKHGIK